MGLSIAVMFVTQLLWYLGCDAATPASKPKRRSRPPGGAMTDIDCQSVPHHVLWQKLDLHPTTPHKRLHATAATISLPVADESEIESIGELDVQLRRRRRSHSAPVSLQSRSRTRRSELAYRRLIRSIEGHQRHDEASNSTSVDDRSRRRLRRLRRRLRRQPTTGTAAHHCHLERFWKRMSRGVFPPYVETGRCAQTTCMFGLYECTRRRYALKILRRVPRRCNPLPSISANTTYEHVWRFAEYHVTVGCECARKPRPGRIDFKKTTTTSSTPSGG